MANVDFFSAFGYAWGENGAIDQWVDTQYKLGWASIGSVPPSVEQFNRVHQIADQKANWLYGQLKAAATATGVTLAAGDLSALVQILAATAPDASTTKKGLIEIATATEAKALTSTLLAITPATLAAVLADFRSGIPGATFAEVDALTEDQGPIICTDMAGDLYVWTESAYFIGYRNPRSGLWYGGANDTPEAWELLATGGVWSESDPKHARVIARYRERGRTVAAGAWTKGWNHIADLGSGDWKAPDLQNVFQRMSGTDADTANARAAGSYQSDALQNITGSISGVRAIHGATGAGALSITLLPASYSVDGAASYPNANVGFDASDSARTSVETRSESVAVAPVILI